ASDYAMGTVVESPALLVLLMLLFYSSIGVCVGSIGNVSSRQVDVIEELQLWNTTYQGLTVIPGPRPFAPAVFLQGESREVRVSEVVQMMAAGLLSTTPREF
ncbi:unnamed protein product, partial [Meganyctiphanes norvegica]